MYCYAFRNITLIQTSVIKIYLQSRPGARPTKHISIEFEIRWKFRAL